MKIEGVNFIDAAVKSLSEEEFTAMHMEVVWQDRKKTQRKKMLHDAYKAITEQ